MNFIKSALVLFEVLMVFNIIIFVHELGHFLAARWRGLKVDRFAIWFGKPIWKKKIGGVEYALGCVPFGGYVSLPQMAPMDMIEGKAEGENTQPLPPIQPLDKIIVAIAGPLFSFGLAILFAVVVWKVGKPGASAQENSTTIGWVDPSGPAFKAGIRPGDKILKIDGRVVTQFVGQSPDSIQWRVVTSENPEIEVQYERNGVTNTVSAAPIRRETKWYERKDLPHLLIEGVRPASVEDVATNSPVFAAGLQKGDQILSADGQKVYSLSSIVELEDSFSNKPPRAIVFSILRNGQVIEKTITPEKPVKPAKSSPSFGFVSFAVNTNEFLEHPLPMTQVHDSAMQIVNTFSTLISPKSKVGVQQMGGAVMIIRVYYNLLDNPNGWRQVLWFSVVLNVNLALINLLPLPVLDGGHILLALLEFFFRRRMSARIVGFIQNACAMLLIGFMAYVFFFDTSDLVRSVARNHEPAIEFAPKN